MGRAFSPIGTFPQNLLAAGQATALSRTIAVVETTFTLPLFNGADRFSNSRTARHDARLKTTAQQLLFR